MKPDRARRTTDRSAHKRAGTGAAGHLITVARHQVNRLLGAKPPDFLGFGLGELARHLAAGELFRLHVVPDLLDHLRVGQRGDVADVEYATMLEDINRFVSAAEAQRVAGLSDELFQEMREITVKVNEVITRHASEAGLRHCDGKVEYLVSGDARMVLADSPATPDESRLMFGDVHCGKQVIRNWYVAHGLEVPVRQLISDGIPRSRWPVPATLPPGFIPAMSDMYRSLSEAWTGERIWNAPDLQTATQAVRRITSC